MAAAQFLPLVWLGRQERRHHDGRIGLRGQDDVVGLVTQWTRHSGRTHRNGNFRGRSR